MRLEFIKQPAGSAPFAHALARARVTVARSVELPAESWPLVNCTSMEKGCTDCVGPVPALSAIQKTDDGSSTDASSSEEPLVLVPFGATDARIAVLPVKQEAL